MPERLPEVRGYMFLRLVQIGCRILILFCAIAIASGVQIVGRIHAAEVDAANAIAPVGFADVVDRVRPAVVGVRARIDNQSQAGGAIQEFSFPQGSPLERFFRQFGLPPSEAQSPKSDDDFNLGSGFFISGDGYIVTNNHVIANSANIEVRTADGRTFQAKVVGTDSQTDLALIKITARDEFSYVRLASAEPRIGDWVLPIGNPFGLGGTVTAGIVSARGRDIGEGPYSEFIQIDAPVNEGDSGGPTFNVRGEVVGVNTLIYSPSGGSVGVAFDVPAETVRLVVRELKEKGRVTRGWIGVQIQSVTWAIAEALGLETARGVLVAQIEARSPAETGGVEVGDIVTSVNGKDAADARDFAKTIAAIPPGTSAELGIVRNGQKTALAVRVGELSNVLAPRIQEQVLPSEKSALGLTLAPARSRPGLGDRGVVVIDIGPDSSAANADLQTGDVILSVRGQAVDRPADISKLVNEARALSKRFVLAFVKRADATRYVAIAID